MSKPTYDELIELLRDAVRYCGIDWEQCPAVLEEEVDAWERRVKDALVRSSAVKTDGGDKLADLRQMAESREYWLGKKP